MKHYHILSIIFGILLIAYIVFLRIKTKKLGFKNLSLQLKLNSERQLLSECQNKISVLEDVSDKNTKIPDYSDVKEKSNIPLPKKITQHAKNGDIIGNFTSLRDASKKTGKTRYIIKKSCDNPKDINHKSYFRYTK